MTMIFKPLPQTSGALFLDTQQQAVFSDCKTFVDCIPRFHPDHVISEYERLKANNTFSLSDFIDAHFMLPTSDRNIVLDQNRSMEEHIHALWSQLTYTDTSRAHSSLIPLPNHHVVPGGRFREIYYWDTYFTAEGLAACQQWESVRNMAYNFAYLIEKIGHIPNGNRTYYCSRSQPPIFSCLINLLAQHDEHSIAPLIATLEKEYAFWMDGKEKCTDTVPAHRRVVRLAPNTFLNRYWDDDPSPRPESFREDIALFAKATEAQQQHLYRHVRAACESGWDFSSRWLKEQDNLASIHTTNLIPIDLNTLLYHTELTLSEYMADSGDMKKSSHYAKLAENRKKAIDTYCWNQATQFYHDYCWTEQKTTSVMSLAGVFPLFFNIASQEKANCVAKAIKNIFLFPGGLVTTPHETGQQWDSPNGWAPLQWIAVHGLKRYGFTILARDIAKRWVTLNRHVFQRTKKMMEKYNVCDASLEAGGGEYPLQDGFGWSNAIAIAFIREFAL